MVVDLGKPLLSHVLEACGRGDGEADEEDVGLRVGKRTQAIVVLLSCRIEEAKGVGLIADPGTLRK